MMFLLCFYTSSILVFTGEMTENYIENNIGPIDDSATPHFNEQGYMPAHHPLRDNKNIQLSEQVCFVIPRENEGI